MLCQGLEEVEFHKVEFQLVPYERSALLMQSKRTCLKQFLNIYRLLGKTTYFCNPIIGSLWKSNTLKTRNTIGNRI